VALSHAPPNAAVRADRGHREIRSRLASPTSHRENASASRHSRRSLKSLAKTSKSASHRPVALRSRIHARRPASVPDHLSDAPVRQAFTEDYWCTDFISEYEVPVRASRAKIHGCCRADGEWPALSRHHWLVSRHRPRRLPRGEAAIRIWQSLSAEITPSRRSRFRRPTKRCNTRWRRTVQAQPIGAYSHLLSFFMKLRFEFSRSKCRALKDPYVG